MRHTKRRRDLLVKRDREPLSGAHQSHGSIFDHAESPDVVYRREFRFHTADRF
jgi:hypothetical protein